MTPTDAIPAAVGAAVAAVLSPLFSRLGTRLGLVDQGGDDLKIHPAPVPVLGGLAVVSAAAVGAVAGGRPAPWGLVGAVLVALLGGLVDDANPLPAWVRVLLLAVVGTTLATGFDPPTVFAAVGVILLVLACANAVNIIDGQDGLAGGLAAIAALALAVLAAIRQDEVAVVVGLAGAGALVGFLPWNWPRARLFLGNGGAYAVGVGLAFLAAKAVAADGWRGLLAAGTCLGVFAFEVAFTVARRLVAGGALTSGDRLHSYDLLARTRGRAASTTWFWGLGLLWGALGVGIGLLPLVVGAPLAGAATVTATWWGHRLWARRIAIT